MKIRPCKAGDEARINQAITLLREARDLLSVADAPKAVDKVRRALKSTEGARRHMYRRSIGTPWRNAEVLT